MPIVAKITETDILQICEEIQNYDDNQEDENKFNKKALL